ncbi:MAG: hypothetical protein GY852_06615, partial [bacterium]|nr:hypothetical protein [bacterium]
KKGKPTKPKNKVSAKRVVAGVVFGGALLGAVAIGSHFGTQARNNARSLNKKPEAAVVEKAPFADAGPLAEGIMDGGTDSGVDAGNADSGVPMDAGQDAGKDSGVDGGKTDSGAEVPKEAPEEAAEEEPEEPKEEKKPEKKEPKKKKSKFQRIKEILLKRAKKRDVMKEEEMLIRGETREEMWGPEWDKGFEE